MYSTWFVSLIALCQPFSALPLPAGLPLGAAYLCLDCDRVVAPDHAQCRKCGSREVVPVESFVRRVKQQVRMRIYTYKGNKR